MQRSSACCGTRRDDGATCGWEVPGEGGGMISSSSCCCRRRQLLFTTDASRVTERVHVDQSSMQKPVTSSLLLLLLLPAPQPSLCRTSRRHRAHKSSSDTSQCLRSSNPSASAEICLSACIPPRLRWPHPAPPRRCSASLRLSTHSSSSSASL